MKNLLWFLFGVIGGFVAAHLLNKDPRGHEVLSEVDARITEFTDRIGDAYREQESRFAGIVDSVKSTASDAVETASDLADQAKDAASGAVESVTSAAKKLTD